MISISILDDPNAYPFAESLPSQILRGEHPMPTTPIALTDQQMDAVLRAAEPLEPQNRADHFSKHWRRHCKPSR
jgi:hypothetical protein